MYAPDQELNGINKLEIDIRKKVPQKPQLSKEICLQDFKSLQHFLTLSRSVVDDNLRSYLNGLLNKNETESNSILKFVRSSSDNGCSTFLQSVVYSEWQKRVEVIQFCQKQVDSSLNDKFDDNEFAKLTPEEKHEMLRIDPYTYKNLEQKYLRKNAQLLELQNLFNTEDKVEKIIIDRSTEMIAEQCNLHVNDIKHEFLNYMSKLDTKSI
ncbi:hypothetical protein CANINC_000497 [Pichia inconspicua]|uniref:Uncharacterized protein n=1 Tax=Pichia inconspicua TaxID=52247 RepID=A0A4T0X6E9_9ASCO|nr:hypothetical protein CANINC_000497 [[Candida] inconspicua]